MILQRKLSSDLPASPQSVNVIPIDGSTLRVRVLFAIVFEDAITQMCILERCNNKLGALMTMSDVEYLKAVKYGVYDSNVIKDELYGIDPHNLNCLIYKVKKFDADRKHVKDMMIATYMSLGQSFTFDPLVKCITSIEELQRYRAELLEEEKKKKMLRRELSKQLKKQRNRNKTIMYDTETIIAKLRTDIQNSSMDKELCIRYIDKWQVARTEQHTQTIFDIENGPATTTNYYKQRSDHELRVHNEMVTLVSILITEKLHEIEEWMDKFDNDTEKISYEIQIKKKAYLDMRDKRMGYEETLKTHEMQMKNWIAVKKAREDKRTYKLKMYNAATIVQAWWRGLLVRLKLGKYKIKKKNKKGKKK